MPTPPPTPTRHPQSPEGLAAARRYCTYHLGYAKWADDILDVYLNPAPAMAKLDKADEEHEAEMDKARERIAAEQAARLAQDPS